MNLIEDYDQFQKFLNVLPPLRPGEAYFISLSARNKYLSDAERAEIGLGRTEMYGRTTVKSLDDFYYAMRKLAAIDSYRLTRGGLPIPSKCRVVYVNINPSSMVGAYSLFTNQMNAIQAEAIKALQSGKAPNLEAFERMERHLKNAIQKSLAQKYYLDVDIDSKDKGVVAPFMWDRLVADLEKHSIEYHIVETIGGYHVLVNQQNLNKTKYKLHLLVKELNAILTGKGEAVFNSNAMVPMPGTLQAGQLVKIL